MVKGRHTPAFLQEYWNSESSLILLLKSLDQTEYKTRKTLSFYLYLNHRFIGKLEGSDPIKLISRAAGGNLEDLTSQNGQQLTGRGEGLKKHQRKDGRMARPTGGEGFANRHRVFISLYFKYVFRNFCSLKTQYSI